MSITLEQVDQLRERTGVSYQKAKELLEQTNGDVLEAIVLFETVKPGKEKMHQSASDFGNEVIKTLKDLLNSGKVNRILVEKNGENVMNIPVAVGALGALFLTSATAIGLIAALATGCIIKIHKEDGEIVNVNDMASEMMKKTKDKATEVYEATMKHVHDPHVVTEEDEEEQKEEDIPSVKVEVEETDDEVVVKVTEE